MPHRIEIPELKADIAPGTGSPGLVVVAGGRPPSTEWLNLICRGKKVLAVDRGIEVCRKAVVSPSYYFGDNDSASPEGILWAKTNRIPSAIFPAEKDMTDLQLTLEMAGKMQIGTSAILTGAFGGRNDHFFANVFTMIWAEEEWGLRVRCAADDVESIYLLRGPETLIFSEVEVGTVVSTLSLSEKCSGVSVHGLKWPLSGQNIDLKRPFAVSNKVTGTKGSFQEKGEKVSFSVKVSRGWMGIYITSPEAEEKGWN